MLLLFAYCPFVSAQDLAGSKHIKMGMGTSYLEGNISRSAYQDINLSPGFNLSLSYEGYGKARRKGSTLYCVGGEIGYEFIFAPINQSQLLQYFGEGSTLQFNRTQSLLQGPFGRLIIGLNQPFHPFIGLGFHTAFFRPATFTVENQATKNFYSRLDYQATSIGRINPTASVMAGIRYITPWKLSLGLKAQAFLRQTWTQQYKIEAAHINQLDDIETYTERLHRKGNWATVELNIAYSF